MLYLPSNAMRYHIRLGGPTGQIGTARKLGDDIDLQQTLSICVHAYQFQLSGETTSKFEQISAAVHLMNRQPPRSLRINAAQYDFLLDSFSQGGAL